MSKPRGIVSQAAVLAFQGDQLCLVTSRDRKHWVIPKGCLKTGTSPAETALQEAWEEAGLVGSIRRDQVFTYVYRKTGQLHHVAVFVMDVTSAAKDWPERGQRQRRWLCLEDAIACVENQQLRQALRKTRKELPGRPNANASRQELEWNHLQVLLQDLKRMHVRHVGRDVTDWTCRCRQSATEIKLSMIVRAAETPVIAAPNGTTLSAADALDFSAEQADKAA